MRRLSKCKCNRKPQKKVLKNKKFLFFCEECGKSTSSLVFDTAMKNWNRFVNKLNRPTPKRITKKPNPNMAWYNAATKNW